MAETQLLTISENSTALERASERQRVQGAVRCGGGRRELEENMVITLEPGIYFIRQLLEPALQNPRTACFFNKGRVEEYFDFGGGLLLLAVPHGRPLMSSLASHD